MNLLFVLLLVLNLEDMPTAAACTEVWQLATQIESAPDRAAAVSKLMAKPLLRQKTIAANNFLTLGGHASQLAKVCAI